MDKPLRRGDIALVVVVTVWFAVALFVNRNDTGCGWARDHDPSWTQSRYFACLGAPWSWAARPADLRSAEMDRARRP